MYVFHNSLLDVVHPTLASILSVDFLGFMLERLEIIASQLHPSLVGSVSMQVPQSLDKELQPRTPRAQLGTPGLCRGPPAKLALRQCSPGPKCLGLACSREQSVYKGLNVTEHGRTVDQRLPFHGYS